MNLLIVDDEKLTRQGLLDSLDLEKLGIGNVRMAEDGLAVLAVSRMQESRF